MNIDPRYMGGCTCQSEPQAITDIDQLTPITRVSYRSLAAFAETKAEAVRAMERRHDFYDNLGET